MYDERALAPGYWFVSPYGKVEQTNNDKPYVGPAIYDSTNGELVWNGAPMFQRYNTYSLKVSKVNDKDMISLLHPLESHGIIMNGPYSAYTRAQDVMLTWSGMPETCMDFMLILA